MFVTVHGRERAVGCGQGAKSKQDLLRRGREKRSCPQSGDRQLCRTVLGWIPWLVRSTEVVSAVGP